MENIASFIDRLGGAAVVAEKIGKRRNTVHVAVHRDALPRGWWPNLMKEFPTVTNDQLLELEAAANRDGNKSAA